jgi:predicted nucleic acid-binding protein
VFAELGANPNATADELDHFLQAMRIRTEWMMSESVWRAAAAKFDEYATRRRRSGGGEPRRLIADFVIGAHAAEAGHLATRDREFYRAVFPEIVLVDAD